MFELILSALSFPAQLSMQSYTPPRLTQVNLFRLDLINLYLPDP
jgi:hypothetical protein